MPPGLFCFFFLLMGVWLLPPESEVKKSNVDTYNIDRDASERTLTIYPLSRDNDKRLWSMTNAAGPPV